MLKDTICGVCLSELRTGIELNTGKIYIFNWTEKNITFLWLRSTSWKSKQVRDRKTLKSRNFILSHQQTSNSIVNAIDKNLPGNSENIRLFISETASKITAQICVIM